MDLFHEYIARNETVQVFDTGWYEIGTKPLATAVSWSTIVYGPLELLEEQTLHIRDILSA